MANKNHDLDARIIESAQQEFLLKGYDKASLRKIAASAGVTIGAIYTRYKTKDELFYSLAEPLIRRIQDAFEMIREGYSMQTSKPDPKEFIKALQMESDTILHLLFDDYDRAVLLLTRSTGSSLEHFFDGIVDRKIELTLQFFQASGMQHPDDAVLKLLIKTQFHSYFQIIEDGYDLSEAKDMMNQIMVYHTGGWLSVLGLSAPEDH